MDAHLLKKKKKSDYSCKTENFMYLVQENQMIQIH